MPVERLDRQLVDLLAADGRMSFTDLGKATGLSTSAVHQRVRRLEERGVITGFHAAVDPDAMGLPLTALISVTPLDPAAPDDVPDRLTDIREIEAAAPFDVGFPLNFLYGGPQQAAAPDHPHDGRVRNEADDGRRQPEDETGTGLDVQEL